MHDQIILVLGISRSVREMLSSSLQRDGYEVVTAPDAATAFALAQEFSFDFIVTDGHEEGARETLERIRSLQPQVLVVMAADPANGLRPADRQAWPVEEWISKPIRIPELKAALERRGRRQSWRPRRPAGRSGALEFRDAVRSFEKNLIEEALQRTNRVKSQAARLLNINRTTLIEKMKRLNIPS